MVSLCFRARLLTGTGSFVTFDALNIYFLFFSLASFFLFRLSPSSSRCVSILLEFLLRATSYVQQSSAPVQQVVRIPLVSFVLTASTAQNSLGDNLFYIFRSSIFVVFAVLSYPVRFSQSLRPHN